MRENSHHIDDLVVNISAKLILEAFTDLQQQFEPGVGQNCFQTER